MEAMGRGNSPILNAYLNSGPSNWEVSPPNSNFGLPASTGNTRRHTMSHFTSPSGQTQFPYIILILGRKELNFTCK